MKIEQQMKIFDIIDDEKRINFIKITVTACCEKQRAKNEKQKIKNNTKPKLIFLMYF